ncbi:hypothetical protein CK203_084362 [Vitis vinifera]|uniref:DUF7746 domain-containing protein n=1 Tax=Vitis vinifera TaxID=29760 RepID=A0A438DF85_VITVI|nr:hypothetical protein CK203_084362 [Vitis vinifera]
MVKGDISSEEEADELIKMFEEPHNQILTTWKPLRLGITILAYFPDMQFEERNQYTQASYTSGTIYEWNIDGMTEYNILTKLQEMTMVSLRVGGIIISLLMIEIVSLKPIGLMNNEVVKDEDGQDIEDAVATLIYSISKHFIGDPAKIKDKTADLLTNLKCPKLHDFRWYKEVFLTKVMLRFDQQSPKEVSIKELHEEVKAEQLKIAFKKVLYLFLYEETSESLFGANGKRLAIKVHETMAPKKNTQAPNQKTQSSQAPSPIKCYGANKLKKKKQGFILLTYA